MRNAITGQEAVATASMLSDMEIVSNGHIDEAVFQGSTSEDTDLARRGGTARRASRPIGSENTAGLETVPGGEIIPQDSSLVK